jgi:hypothetical protein
MYRRTVFVSLAMLLALRCSGQEAAVPTTKVELIVHPQKADVGTSIRLLPADPELRNGNAAPIMLRIIWEQRNYMQNIVPQFDGLLALPYNDPQIAKIISFGGFQHQLHRAAYTSDAEWDYPLNEESMDAIMLPDVQGFRNFAGRGMSLWIGTLWSYDISVAEKK